MVDSHGVKLCDEYCIGCMYHSISLNCCDYSLFKWNSIRGCSAGTGCDKRRYGKFSGKDLRSEAVETDFDFSVNNEYGMEDSHRNRMMLYNQGMTFGEIARTLNVDHRRISRWGAKYNLESNYKKRLRQKKLEDKGKEELEGETK